MAKEKNGFCQTLDQVETFKTLYIPKIVSDLRIVFNKIYLKTQKTPYLIYQIIRSLILLILPDALPITPVSHEPPQEPSQAQRRRFRLQGAVSQALSIH